MQQRLTVSQLIKEWFNRKQSKFEKIVDTQIERSILEAYDENVCQALLIGRSSFKDGIQ